ncbi:protein Shroom4 isoform X2 [Tiliqua scincoides]
MHFPADAFSLSWHSGCDPSDLPLPWTPLSRHCSTDKSSSLGSMESLDQPSQTYYEGSLSPIDQVMDQNKRDSAYSSFSASSSTSDSALRPEESSSGDGPPQGQLPDPRYLQTGSGGGREPSSGAVLPSLASQLSPHSRSASRIQDSSRPARAPSPPKPPVRQDSLQTCHPPPVSTEIQRASPQTDTLHSSGRWTSDTSLCVRSRDSEGPGGLLATDGHVKEALLADQYYLLSSHTDQLPAMERGVQAIEECEGPPQLVVGGESEAQPSSPDSCPSPWKECWTGPLAHRHSAPEHLLAAQLQTLNIAPHQESPHWTVSPLHQEQRASEPWKDRDPLGQEVDSHPAVRPGAGSCSPSTSSRAVLQRPRSASAESAPSLSLPPPADLATGLKAAPGAGAVMEGGQEADGVQAASRKGSSAQHRSAHMRRRSNRFATNLRNEIQWRKAQLQKGKGSTLLLCGEEPVPEAEEPPSTPSAPAFPPPARPSVAESRPHSLAPPLRTAPPKRWASELSVLQAERACQSSSKESSAPEPKWKAPLSGAKRPQKTLPLLPGGEGGGGRWRWSPEHKLQPHSRGLQGAEPGSPSRLSEESGLLPFSERRKFFEETSRPLPSAHTSPQHSSRPAGSRPPQGVEQIARQAAGSERQGQRRHSMDPPYVAPPPPPRYQDFRPETPVFYHPPARHGDCECWRSLLCSCAAAREACACCRGDRGPALLQRNMSVPSTHQAHHCHPHCWVRCSDCCCPARHQHLEDGAPWPVRKTFQAEFPLAEWEPQAINRKSSQSMSELSQHQVGFARLSPFWPSCESVEPEWTPFCRAVSTHNLAWDCSRPEQVAEDLAYEEGAGEPLKNPPRERAYSESRLSAEPTGTSPRERRDSPLAKLEEAAPESTCIAKKKGPPPPRPPPPNWEKYCPRRASHHQLLPSKAGFWAPAADSRAPSPSATEVARQRSQSLPLERLWHDAARQPGPQPQKCPSPAEHYYRQSLPHGTPEWQVPEASSRNGSSRSASSPEEERQLEPSWDQEPSRLACRTLEQQHSSAASLALPGQEALPEGSNRGPAPPLRLNSEELMWDVAGRDRALARVLSPAVGLVSAAEVMDSLFSPGEGLVWKGQDWQLQPGGKAAFPSRQQAQPASPMFGGAVSPTSCSAYYSLSAGKAELLNKMKELPKASSEEEEEDRDLARKKVQLIESISRKLAVLQEAQRGLQEDVGANAVLGREVESHVQRVCKPQEFEKFRLFIGDLDKVVNLLLSLSGRLARVENALSSLDAGAPEEEKLALLEKKRQLTAQLEDAKELQEHVTRRERLVFACVSRCLPSEPLQDYQHFVHMKSALAIQQRQLDDKIKLGEEQLRCLQESLGRAPREY